MMRMRRYFGAAVGVVVCAGGGFSGGCTAESTRIAIETQQRANEVQQAVFERQNEALRVLLFRDLVAKLEAGAAGGAGLSDAQRAAVNGAWNDRDLVDFWSVQNERAKALRLAGVDAKLYSEQSVVDLLIKSIEAKVDRGKEGVAGYVGKQISQNSEVRSQK